MWSYNILPDLAGRLPEFGCDRLAAIEADGFEAFGYRLSSITGTYIETGAHMLMGAPLLGDLDPGAFIRPAVACHVAPKGRGELIRRAELEASCPPVQPGDALLIECGWGSRWGDPDYVTGSPAFHIDCLPWLLEQPFAILGVDVPCIENARSRPSGRETAGNMLVPIFQRGVLLLAPLVNLDQVQAPRGQLIALPLNIRAVSGAPCRAVFIG
jgi:kynurenine formamidase